MKKVLISLLLLCSVFCVVGCSSDDGEATPTATAKTPIQTLGESVDTRFTEVWERLNGLPSASDVTALATRVGLLETQVDDLEAPDLSGINTRLTGLESLNISDQFSDILAEIAYLKIQSPSDTVTPTPTPFVQCGVQKPSVVTPAYGATIPNGSTHFEWTTCVNAVTYEFWIGTDPSSMLNWKNVSAPARFLDYPVNANTYYYWKVVAISPCGDKSQDAWWFKTQ